jgi:hypothetical protein
MRFPSPKVSPFERRVHFRLLLLCMCVGQKMLVDVCKHFAYLLRV